MFDAGIVYGCEQSSQPLIVGATTVYVHTDVEQAVDSEGNLMEGLYKYNEVQYTKDEYIQIISEKNSGLEAQVIETQKALCDIYEAMS